MEKPVLVRSAVASETLVWPKNHLHIAGLFDSIAHHMRCAGRSANIQGWCSDVLSALKACW